MIFNQVVSQESADAGIFQKYTSSIAPEDPMEVYERTRPSDWLPMPTPSDNEIYMLVHIPDRASTRLQFTVSCSDTCLVEIGTVRNGIFITNIIDTAQSDTKYDRELFYSDFADLTSDNMEQAIVKISGATITGFNIGDKAGSNYSTHVINVVELWCNIPSCTSLSCGGCLQLRYFRMIGTSQLANADDMFHHCYSLLAVLQLDISMATTMRRTFRECYNLIAIPQLDTSSVTAMNDMFDDCRSIRAIPAFDTSIVDDFTLMFSGCRSLLCSPVINVNRYATCGSMFSDCSSMMNVPTLNYAKITNANSMFSGCSSLVYVSNIAMSKSTDVRYMFKDCTSLRSIGNLVLSLATDLMQMFDGCYSLISIGKLSTPSASSAVNIFLNCSSLAALSFDKTISSWSGVDVTLPSSLSPNGVVAFFNSLPTITSSKTITLSQKQWNNITDAEKLIATNKKWALTYS